MPAPTPRTTAALVKGIVEVQDGVDVTPYIMSANSLVTRVCTYTTDSQGNPVTPYTDGYENSEMELIERWLSAHFYTIFDNQLSAARAGPVGVVYQNVIDLGLKSSMYGQTAMLMDRYGGLAALDNVLKRKRAVKVSISCLGTPPTGLPVIISDISVLDL